MEELFSYHDNLLAETWSLNESTTRMGSTVLVSVGGETNWTDAFAAINGVIAEYLHSFLEWMVDHDKVTPSIRKNLKKFCHGVLVLLARYKITFKLKETSK